MWQFGDRLVTQSGRFALKIGSAESIRDWLVKKGGLSGVSFTTKGFGETQPVAPNANADGSDNPEGRQKNRRVTIVMTK